MTRKLVFGLVALLLVVTLLIGPSVTQAADPVPEPVLTDDGVTPLDQPDAGTNSYGLVFCGNNCG